MPLLRVSGGYDLSYEVLGSPSAPHTCLLVMGFACSRHYWNPLPAFLLRSHCRLIWADTRGFGSSTDSLWTRATTTSLAQDFLDLLDHLCLPSSQSALHIVGTWCFQDPCGG
jgi:pimeloyl-ACP methyl ester carboxylesterase